MSTLKNRTCLLLLGVGVLMSTASLGTTSIGRAESLGLQQSLMTSQGCGHVIEMLVRHGGLYELGPMGRSATVVPSPYGPFMMPASELGDLTMECVSEAPQSDPACAPTFVVTIGNQSTRDLCDVQVSLVALLGPIRPFNPTAVARVEKIPAGASVEVAIQLPIEALAMGRNGSAVIGFQKLLVAIDSLDQYVELDEANNLKLLCRADIPQQVVIVEPPAIPIEVEVPIEVTPVPNAPQVSLDAALEEFGLNGSTEGKETALRL